MSSESNASNITEPKPVIHIDERGERALKQYRHEILTYLREVPRLLEEGEEGRYALLKGDEILSIWDTQSDAIQAGVDKFGLEPICVLKISRVYLKRFGWLDLGEERSCPS